MLRSDFLITSYHFNVLLDFCAKTGCAIVIPTIVFEEIASLYRKELILRLQNLNKSGEDFNRIILNPKPFEKKEIDIEELVSNYIIYLKTKLGPNLKEIRYKDEFLPELVKRSIERIKPISPKGQEFRDAILWLSILEYFKEENFEHEISFITNNVNDFANNSKTDLHPDLSAEIKNLRPTLKLFNSIKSFAKEIAIDIEFITIEWIIENIDWDRLQVGAKQAVEGIDPTYFYEYYHRKNISDDILEYWSVLSARFSKKVDEFHVFNQKGEDSYGIEIQLSGASEIEFENAKHERFNKTVVFGTTIYVYVLNNKIIKYDDTYYPEETGLDFYN